ncbi:SDR family oxidoreductase [Alphaproteobacteria bacterium]|nr:SDR family oxidoreductase [Alphaproteobacteria bacterium]
MIVKFNISGRCAVITGGAGLLGTAHAKALLNIGATIVLTDISHKELMAAANALRDSFPSGSIHTFVMDVTSETSIVETADKIVDLGLRIDILINNAAINPSASSLLGTVRTTRLENFSLDRWNLEVSVGLTGAFLCSKVFGTSMASDGKGGVILNIASDLSVIAPDQNLYRQEGLADDLQAVKPVTYSVIKTGLVGLTRYLSSYWADKGVRANALSPGGVYIDQNQEFVTRLEQLIPMGRMAEPDEYIGAIQFLCSDASAYMNGQNIVMDGGRSVI